MTENPSPNPAGAHILVVEDDKDMSMVVREALKALGHQVTIAAFCVPGEAFDCEDLDANTYYLPLPSYRTSPLAVWARSYLERGKQGT